MSYSETKPFEGNGWPRDLFVNPPKQVFICGNKDCNMVLKDPYQLDCGHRLCKACLDLYKTRPGNERICMLCVYDIKSEDAEPGTEPNITEFADILDQVKIEIDRSFQDKSAAKEIQRLEVKCYWPECRRNDPKKLLFCKDLERHLSECKYRLVKCDQCERTIIVDSAEDHFNNLCDMRKMVCPNGCGQTDILAKDLQDHKAKCQNKPEHCAVCNTDFRESLEWHLMNSCKGACPLGCQIGATQLLKHHVEAAPEKLMDELLPKLQEIKEKLKADELDEFPLYPCKHEMHKLIGRILEVEGQNIYLFNQLAEALEKSPDEFTTVLNNAKDSAENRGKLETLSNLFKVLNRDVNLLSEFELNFRELEKQVFKQEEESADKLKKLDEKATRKMVEDREVGELLNNLLATSYNGVFLWCLTDVANHRKKAQSGEVATLLSPPFFSDRYGYKMCLRLYLNGDSSGARTHVSLYFVVMRGEYDAILTWPFNHKVTMILRNQKNGRNITDSFKPDPGSAFQRPSTDKNTPSGFPMFVSQEESFGADKGYVVDDMMFIECKLGPIELTSQLQEPQLSTLAETPLKLK